MRKGWIASLLLILLSMSACGGGVSDSVTYECISPTEAKQWMECDPSCVILDVRTEAEYAEGHIPNAILLPHEEIAEKAKTVIPNKNVLILVYCRSGRRSKLAAEVLVSLGYTNVKEFGGILDWPYETE